MTNQWQLNWRSWWLLSILCQRRTAHFTVGFTSNGGYRSFGSKIQESLTTPIHHYIYINLSFYQNCNSAAVFGKDYITSPSRKSSNWKWRCFLPHWNEIEKYLLSLPKAYRAVSNRWDWQSFIVCVLNKKENRNSSPKITKKY